LLEQYLKVLGEEADDLIGKCEEEQEEVDEGHSCFGWKRVEKKYKMIQFIALF
jgi:hypothetical protein